MIFTTQQPPRTAGDTPSLVPKRSIYQSGHFGESWCVNHAKLILPFVLAHRPHTLRRCNQSGTLTLTRIQTTRVAEGHETHTRVKLPCALISKQPQDLCTAPRSRRTPKLAHANTPRHGATDNARRPNTTVARPRRGRTANSHDEATQHSRTAGA